MTPLQSADTLGVECYVRAASLVAPVDANVEALRDHERRGVIDDLAVETWPDEVALTGAAEETTEVARYRRFETWAERAGVSLRPAFAVRERTTLVDDGAEVVLTLPVFCLAVSVNGHLELVAPHRTASTTYAVDDVLADLAALDRDAADVGGQADETPGPATRSATRTPDRCPECGESLVTGQGLYACPACSWSGLPAAGRHIETRPGIREDDERDAPLEAPPTVER